MCTGLPLKGSCLIWSKNDLLGSALTADLIATNEESGVDYAGLYAKGRRTFALLFSRWMDTNEWSHPTMVKLSHNSMGSVRWLHSSSISGLRHGNLPNPGPRLFIAIERLNYYLHRYNTTKLPIPGTKSSNDYRHAFAITEDGEAPPAGWWYEVFCGVRTPKDIDLHEAHFTETQASELSSSWGALIRKLMRDRDLDVITDLDRVLRESYPARDFERLTRLREVIANQAAWSADEFTMEIPALTTLTAELGGPSKEQDLLFLLQESSRYRQ